MKLSSNKLHLLFPSQVYQVQIAKEQSCLCMQLKQEVYKFKKLDTKGQEWSKKNYRGGYTSYGSLTNMYDLSPYFAELKSKIDKHVLKYVNELQMDIKPQSISMCSMWMNIMPKNVYHTMHIHPHSIISGTFYLQAPDRSSGLKFEDPRMVSYMNTPPRKQNAKMKNRWFVELQAGPGELILFESWLRHEVPPNRANSDRISISFNYN